MPRGGSWLRHLRLALCRGLTGAWKGEGKGCWEGARAPPPIRTSRAQVPEATLQEILPKVLRADLNSVLGSPEHLELFLLARQKVPRKLEELVGPVSLFSDENVPRYGGGGRAGRAGRALPLAPHRLVVWMGCSCRLSPRTPSPDW